MLICRLAQPSLMQSFLSSPSTLVSDTALDPKSREYEKETGPLSMETYVQ